MTEIDHKAFLKTLSAEQNDALTARSDAAGLRHLALHAGLILLLGLLIAAQVPFWWALMLPQGILIAFLFTLQHECTHKTPFASDKLNEWVGWATGVAIFQPFLWFRYFHLAHHRHTNIPGKDPELDGLPKPEDWSSFAWHLSTLGYWASKVQVFLGLAFGKADAPYLPAKSHARLSREARGMLAIYAAVLVVTVMISPVLVWVWFVPLVLGFPVLRLYLLAEHGRCPNVANMFVNTRTTYTSALVRLLAWNMPYHIEHHVYPQVPFHKIPDFHAMVRNRLVSTSSGYVAFTLEYVRRFDETRAS